MPSVFPDEYDDLENPTGSTLVQGIHAALHANTNDALEAVQHRVGKTGETDPTSHIARIAALETTVGGLTANTLSGMLNPTEPAYGLTAGPYVQSTARDNRTALQNAINAAIAGDYWIYIPPGIYWIELEDADRDRSVEVVANGSHRTCLIKGAGEGITTLAVKPDISIDIEENFNFDLFTQGDGTQAGECDFVLKDITLQGPTVDPAINTSSEFDDVFTIAGAGGAHADHAVRVVQPQDGVTGLRQKTILENVTIAGQFGAGLGAFTLGDTGLSDNRLWIELRHCDIWGFAGAIALFQDTANQIYLRVYNSVLGGGTTYGRGALVYCHGTINVFIANSTLEKNTRAFVKYAGTSSSGGAFYCIIANCVLGNPPEYASYPHPYAFDLDEDTFAILANNAILPNTSVGVITLGGGDIQVIGGRCQADVAQSYAAEGADEGGGHSLWSGVWIQGAALAGAKVNSIHSFKNCLFSGQDDNSLNLFTANTDCEVEIEGCTFNVTEVASAINPSGVLGGTPTSSIFRVKGNTFRGNYADGVINLNDAFELLQLDDNRFLQTGPHFTLSESDALPDYVIRGRGNRWNPSERLVGGSPAFFGNQDLGFIEEWDPTTRASAAELILSAGYDAHTISGTTNIDNIRVENPGTTTYPTAGFGGRKVLLATGAWTLRHNAGGGNVRVNGGSNRTVASGEVVELLFRNDLVYVR